jgi:archaellum biogenesis protein FlaJ (TadC family)
MVGHCSQNRVMSSTEHNNDYTGDPISLLGRKTVYSTMFFIVSRFAIVISIIVICTSPTWTVTISAVIVCNFMSIGILMCVWFGALNRGDTHESSRRFRVLLHRIRLLACVTMAVLYLVVIFYGPPCVPVDVCGATNVVQILVEVMLFGWNG